MEEPPAGPFELQDPDESASYMDQVGDSVAFRRAMQALRSAKYKAHLCTIGQYIREAPLEELHPGPARQHEEPSRYHDGGAVAAGRLDASTYESPQDVLDPSTARRLDAKSAYTAEHTSRYGLAATIAMRGGGAPPGRAVLAYDTTGDGRLDAFDTNQDGLVDTRAAAPAAWAGGYSSAEERLENEWRTKDLLPEGKIHRVDPKFAS
jgi:hypothetical protein